MSGKSYVQSRASIIFELLLVAAAMVWILSPFIRPTMTSGDFQMSQLIGAVWMATAGIWRLR